MTLFPEKEPGAPLTTRQRLAVLIKIAVSAGLLWVFFEYFDLVSAVEKLADIRPTWLLAAIAAAGCGFALAAQRWSIISAMLEYNLSVVTAFRLLLVGHFFNQVLPSNLGGDALRIWYLTREKISLQDSFIGVFYERCTGLVGLALSAVLFLPLIDSRSPIFKDDSLQISFLAITIAVISGFALLHFLDRICRPFEKQCGTRISAAFLEIGTRFRAVTFSGSRSAIILSMAVIVQIFVSLALAALAAGMGISVPITTWLVIGPFAILASMIPFSFAGWGVREGAMLLMLDNAGVAPEDALALSIAFGILLLLWALPGGVLWPTLRHTVRKD